VEEKYTNQIPMPNLRDEQRSPDIAIR
jgi:hypothetical protein